MDRMVSKINNLKWFCSTGIRLALYMLLFFGAQIIAMLVMQAIKFDYMVYKGLWETIYVIFAVLFLFMAISIERVINAKENAIYKLNQESSQEEVKLERRDEKWCNGSVIKLDKVGIKRLLILLVIALSLIALVNWYLFFAQTIASKVQGGAIEQAVEEYDTAMDRYAYVEQTLVPKWDVILEYISLVIFVPVIEEILFRGLLFGQCKRRLPFVAAVLLSGLLFGVTHGLSIQIGYALIAGMVLGSVYYYFNSLWCSIIVHSVFNLFGGVFFTLGTDFPQIADKMRRINFTLTYVEDIMLLLVLEFALFLIAKKLLVNNKEKEKKEEI